MNLKHSVQGGTSKCRCLCWAVVSLIANIQHRAEFQDVEASQLPLVGPCTCPSLPLSSLELFLSSAAYKYRKTFAAMARHCSVVWCVLDHKENCNRRSLAMWWFCQRKDAQGQGFFNITIKIVRALQSKWKRHLSGRGGTHHKQKQTKKKEQTRKL